MDEWQFERFDSSHDRADFCCGKGPLDDFLRAHVSQYERRGLGRTYVAVIGGTKKVCGYYTLASGAIPVAQLPPKVAKKLPKHPIPAVLLGRLAVDQSAQRRGLGEDLLMDAFRVSLVLSASVGLYAVEVWAIDDQAKRFYEKYAFTPLMDSPRHLYIPMQTAQELFGAD
jgi:GNAT superfamily N-acetyltransferase